MARTATLAAARYETVSATTRRVLEAVQALWRDVPPDRIIAALIGDTGRLILNAVIAGQLSVAQGAQAFVTGAMMAQGAGTEQAGRLVPEAFANVAADGRPLSTLLFQPAMTTASALQGGMSAEAASLRGMTQMAMMVQSTIADTSRAATQTSMAAEPRCISYVRVVKTPACPRCIILSGRQYSYSTGFKRHPRCDCGMEPLSDAEWRDVPTPEDLFKRMTPEQQDAKFGKSAADALRAGADIGQVVNARRGMTTATVGGRTVRTTMEGTAKRGIGGKALRSEYDKLPGRRYTRTRTKRLMPEEIMDIADDREHQIRLLKKHGYIV